MYSQMELEQLRDEHEYIKDELASIARGEAYTIERAKTDKEYARQANAVLAELDERKLALNERRRDIERVFGKKQISNQPDALPIDGTPMVNLRTGATVFAG